MVQYSGVLVNNVFDRSDQEVANGRKSRGSFEDSNAATFVDPIRKGSKNIGAVKGKPNTGVSPFQYVEEYWILMTKKMMAGRSSNIGNIVDHSLSLVFARSVRRVTLNIPFLQSFDGFRKVFEDKIIQITTSDHGVIQSKLAIQDTDLINVDISELGG